MSSVPAGTIYDFEDFRLIPDEGLLLRNRKPVHLHPKALAVLVMLVEHHGHLVSKAEMLEAIWEGAFIEESAISKAVWFARNALGDTSRERFIQTIPRRGYRFVAPVSVTGGSGSFSLAELTGADNNGGAHLTVLNRSAFARPTIGVLLLLTTATIFIYLIVAFAPFRAAQYSKDRPIPDVAAAPGPLEYRPLAPAEDAYFKGVFYFDSATNAAKVSDKNELFSKAILEFERAIAIDTGYAEAYASLARAYHWLGSGGRKPENYVKAKMAAMIAIQLDPSNAKAHASLAWVYWRHEWNWVHAEVEYKQALGLSGDTASPLGHGYALFISAQGRHGEAIDIMRRYEEASPLSISGKVSSAFIKLRARRYDAAEMEFKRILELDPEQDTAISGLAITLACLGRYDDAITVARRASGNYENPAQDLTLAWVYANAGRVKDAAELAIQAERDFRKDQSTVDPYAIAKVYAGLGEIDKAFVWLEEAFSVRSQYLVFLGVSPEFDNLKGDSRFANMLGRLGLPAP